MNTVALLVADDVSLAKFVRSFESLEMEIVFMLIEMPEQSTGSDGSEKIRTEYCGREHLMHKSLRVPVQWEDYRDEIGKVWLVAFVLV